MTTLNLIHLQIILHYITVINYYIIKGRLRSQVITAIKCGNKQNNRVNKMTILNLTHLQIILHYITLTNYYIVKDTFRDLVTTAM